MVLKTFKVEFTVTVVGYCEPSAEDIAARTMFVALHDATDDWATKRRMSYGEEKVTVTDGEGNYSSWHGDSSPPQHSPEPHS